MTGRTQDRPKAELSPDSLTNNFASVRAVSVSLCQPLAIEDYGVQPSDDASPPKWHLAHTAWFFETFLLKPYLAGYGEFHPLYARLFNSYYETVGEFHPRPLRGVLSRPTVEEVYRYRRHVDAAMVELLGDRGHAGRAEIERRTCLGLNHEQQHQELILTDIKAIFAANPLRPAYRATLPPPALSPASAEWIEFPGGIKQIGYSGDGFCFDNETPRHRVFADAFRLASRPVSNGEYLEFIEAGGYHNADLWLSDGWQMARGKNWQAPLYWEKDGGEWQQMTLSGMRALDLAAPVAHVSFFEASAYARFRNARLPTEAEWEIAAETCAGGQAGANFADAGYLQPVGQPGADAALRQMFGDVWEWTASSYGPYPGYARAQGAFGEYNGKFMSGQMVLRGGSCATPPGHVRASYRNFFYPKDRWQFSGIRLAADV